MRGRTHLKSVVIPAFLAFTALSVATSNQALGVSYKAIDLTPSMFSNSGAGAYATSGTQQVGFGYGSATGGNHHALLWSGSGDSVIDLNQFLPTGFTSSDARAIDGYGNIVGIATSSSGLEHAILWQPIPEPATLFLLGLGAVILRKRKK